MDRGIYDPPLLSRWDKINTLNKEIQTSIDWEALQTASIKSPRLRQKWATIFDSRKITTGQIKGGKGIWTSSSCLRGCGQDTEEVNHVFQFNKGDETWEKLKNTT